jgi:hypothetical protein
LLRCRWSYFIHFLQGNRKWDRWFEAEGLKPLDDAQVEAAAADARKSNMGVATEASAEQAAAAQSLKEEEQNRKRRRKTLAAQELVRFAAACNALLVLAYSTLAACSARKTLRRTANCQFHLRSRSCSSMSGRWACGLHESQMFCTVKY